MVSKLIGFHKVLFGAAMLFTILTAAINLYWNSFLADLLDRLSGAVSFGGRGEDALTKVLITAVVIVFVHIVCEYVSACLAAYTCELFAHEMRMGYAEFYLQCDSSFLAKLNVGEEQSAMQNELNEVSLYLHENLFSLAKQFVSFVITVVFLVLQNFKLALASILPVLPLIVYCACSGKVIKSYTGQCQESKQQINGLTGTLLELFPIIQVYGAHGLLKAAYDSRFSEWQRVSVKKERVTAGLMSLSGALSFLPLLVLLGVGGFMVFCGEITIGAFYIFINLSGNVSGFLQNMPKVYAGFRSFCAAVNRIEKKLVL